MIVIKSRVRVLDNSGGRFAEVLNILSKSQRASAKVGDVLVVSVKKIIPHKKVEKGTVYKAIVVRVRNQIFRYGGIFIRFEFSGIILLNSKKVMIGTRVLGIVSQELRKIGCLKILALAPSVV